MITLLFLIQSTFAFNPFEVHEVLKKEFHQELADQGIHDFEFLLNQKSPENLGGASRNQGKATLMIGSDYFFGNSKDQLNLDQFLFIYCHELGHFVGGAPYKKNHGSEWASTEGQADYWATSVCLRKALKVDSLEYLKKVSTLSIAFFKKMRSMIGSEASELEFYALPSESIVESKKFDSEYASFQCRYEIHMAGARELPPPACWLFHSH